MLIYSIYTTIQKSDVSKIYFLIENIFFQQGHIKLIRRDSKDIYNVTKDSVSNKCF